MSNPPRPAPDAQRPGMHPDGVTILEGMTPFLVPALLGVPSARSRVVIRRVSGQLHELSKLAVVVKGGGSTACIDGLARDLVRRIGGHLHDLEHAVSAAEAAKIKNDFTILWTRRCLISGFTAGFAGGSW
jgi:hypothetical protein